MKRLALERAVADHPARTVEGDRVARPAHHSLDQPGLPVTVARQRARRAGWMLLGADAPAETSWSLQRYDVADLRPLGRVGIGVQLDRFVGAEALVASTGRRSEPRRFWSRSPGRSRPRPGPWRGFRRSGERDRGVPLPGVRGWPPASPSWVGTPAVGLSPRPARRRRRRPPVPRARPAPASAPCRSGCGAAHRGTRPRAAPCSGRGCP